MYGNFLSCSREHLGSGHKRDRDRDTGDFQEVAPGNAGIIGTAFPDFYGIICIIVHFVTSTGQEIEVAAKSRLVIQRVANSIAEQPAVWGQTRTRLGSQEGGQCREYRKTLSLPVTGKPFVIR